MYLKRTWIYGNRKRFRKYHTSRYGVKGEKRRSRKKPTDEQMKAVNEKNAIKKLKMLMINNFDSGDWHLTLTYAPENRVDAEESKKLLSKFFRKVREEYRKQGYELKYIIVTEWEKKKLHHHVAINDVPGLSRLLTQLWKHGGIHLTPLYPDQDYEGLAEYFVKETAETFRNGNNPYKQRWSCSRNLKKPEVEVKVIGSQDWRKEPSVSPADQAQGYVLIKDSVKEGVDVFGFPYQEYELIRYARQNQRGNQPGRLRS